MKRRVLAVFTAAMLAATALPASVFGADSFQETEKAAIAGFTDDFISNYSRYMEEYEVAAAGSYGDLTLTLGEAGRAFLGMLLPVDLSWFNDVKLSVNISGDETAAGSIMDVSVNDSKICTIELYTDSESETAYIRIPELSDSYIKQDYSHLTQEAQEALSEETGEDPYTVVVTPDMIMEMAGNPAKALEILPDPEALGNIVSTYSTMFVEGMTDGESGTETLSVGDVSQECTTLTGTMEGEAAVTTLEEILTTMKEDTDIQGILTSWEENLPDAKDLSSKFQEGIDSMLESLTEDGESDGSSLVSKLWTDADGKIVGRQISIEDAQGSQNAALTFQAPSADGAYGLFADMTADGESSFSLSGSGTASEGMINGTYTVSVDSVPAMTIDVTDYDTKAMKEGDLNGTYTLTFLPGPDADETSASLIDSFAFAFTFASEGTAGSVTADVLSEGSSLISLGFAADEGEGVEIPDLTALEGTIYDASSEDDLNTYVEEFNLDTILTNLADAGMPETFVDDLMSLFATSDSTSTYGGADTYEDTYTSEAGDASDAGETSDAAETSDTAEAADASGATE